MEQAHRLLLEFDGVMNEICHAYQQAGRMLGLPESTFWLLYTLWLHHAPLTQTQLIAATSLPAQTVNSALKKLEQQQLVELRPCTQDRRSKEVHLTPQGQTVAANTVARVAAQEQQALGNMGSQLPQFLQLLHLYCGQFKQLLPQLTKEDPTP